MKKRAFLFLQGVCSPFFTRLGDRLKAEGHAVYKVNFNVGDMAYWGLRSNERFSGTMDELPGFIQHCLQRFAITDQVLFGDCRPVHRAAIQIAQNFGIRTHVFEEGYFRPHWITLEREGVNGHSLLPRDPDWFIDSGKRLGKLPDPVPFTSPFWKRAAHDVIYHCASAWNWLAFPRYRTHAPFNAIVEYAGYIKQLPKLRLIAKREENRCSEIISSQKPYYLLPLQLASDAQILVHSSYNGMHDVLEKVLGSFAQHATSSSVLVIKNHPLDIGLVNYRALVFKLAHRFGLSSSRVIFLEGGNLNTLSQRAKGMITVNSTSGMIALQHGCPVFTLADPIYNLPGLTFQGELDDFWIEGFKPDNDLFIQFRKTVIHTTQINGGYYCSKGIELAIENALVHLTSEQSPLEKLL